MVSIKCLSVVLILSLVCLLNAVAQQAEVQNDYKIKLGVYMESLCPDTRRFFLKQLVPTYRNIGQIMDLKLVPFGHARTLGQGKMVCQHGPRECEGNRRMACIIAKDKNQTEVVGTLGCLFEDNESVRSCVSNNMKGVTADEIENCTKSSESYQLMVEAEKETGRLGYVPHLTVNGQSSDEIQDQAEHKLKEFICKQYKGQKPIDGCKTA